jgi:hypothetical protein
MHLVASSMRGSTSACVGHASRQRVQVPHRSTPNGSPGSLFCGSDGHLYLTVGSGNSRPIIRVEPDSLKEVGRFGFTSSGLSNTTTRFVTAIWLGMVSAYAGGADFLSQKDARFGDNARRYHAYVRENDLCLTHTLINPQANRTVGPSGQADPYLAARVVKETDGGIIVSGAKMLATGSAITHATFVAQNSSALIGS